MILPKYPNFVVIFNYNRDRKIQVLIMQIGRFFSLQQGRVGQYLSPRVLVVRSPFQRLPKSGGPSTACYFGFEKLSKAQDFAKYLAGLGYNFQLRRGRMLAQFAYEVALAEHIDLARVLAYWDRMDAKTGGKPRNLGRKSDRTLPTISAALAA